MAAARSVARKMPMNRRGIRAIIRLALIAALALAAFDLMPRSKTLSALSLDSLYRWLDVAAWAVVAGVIIEEVPFFTDVYRLLRVCLFDGFGPAFRIAARHRRRIFESVGFLLLVIGLVYETQLGTDVKNAEASLRLQDEKAVADANVRAAKAQLELARLEATRLITPTQQRTIAHLLADAPKGPFSVVYPMTDSSDAEDFADSIKQTLSKAGYTIVEPPPAYKSILSWSAPGAFLVVNDLASAPPRAAAIQRAFAKVGIFLVGVPKPKDIPPTDVVIVVGSHPYSVMEVPPQLANAPITPVPKPATETPARPRDN